MPDERVTAEQMAEVERLTGLVRQARGREAQNAEVAEFYKRRLNETLTEQAPLMALARAAMAYKAATDGHFAAVADYGPENRDTWPEREAIAHRERNDAEDRLFATLAALPDDLRAELATPTPTHAQRPSELAETAADSAPASPREGQ